MEQRNGLLKFFCKKDLTSTKIPKRFDWTAYFISLAAIFEQCRYILCIFICKNYAMKICNSSFSYFVIKANFLSWYFVSVVKFWYCNSTNKCNFMIWGNWKIIAKIPFLIFFNYLIRLHELGKLWNRCFKACQ